MLWMIKEKTQSLKLKINSLKRYFNINKIIRLHKFCVRKCYFKQKE